MTFTELKTRRTDFSQGGAPRGCKFCIVKEKEGNVHTVADLDEWWHGQKEIILMDSNITASKDCERLFDSLIKSKSLINFEGGGGYQIHVGSQVRAAKSDEDQDAAFSLG